jgi:hypothetical protein
MRTFLQLLLSFLLHTESMQFVLRASAKKSNVNDATS